MKTRLLITALLISLLGVSEAQAQSWRPFVGAGISPLHFSAQNDFSPKWTPYMLQASLRKRKNSLHLNFHNGGRYQKEEFSFTHTIYELAYTFHPMGKISDGQLSPYVGLAANYLQTRFTTQGYPGITAYGLKIEKDNSFGGSLLAGVEYPLGNILAGLQARYNKNSKAQFIAGGFSPQNLITDRFSVMITAAIPLNIKTKYAQNACPEF
ncbi:hypothetical protein [Jiulongibacter sediminis]|jgi:outer membrane protein W|uniref:hypothetical protein n=1 Tax=Jiulongibacter sediminis TaxID=1605367 RepID=UPI0026F23679|nr:hypothetical protein [Jiulongibacter sediminis]